MHTNQKGYIEVFAGVFIIIIAIIAGTILFSQRNSSNVKGTSNSTETTLRQAAASKQQSINSEFDAIEAKIKFTRLKDSYHESCYEGQNNWKVHDGFNYRCTIKVNRFYGFNDSFGPALIEFESKLLESNWKSSDPKSPKPISQVISNYYNKYHPASGNPIEKTSSFGDKYLVSDLPLNAGRSFINNNGYLEIECAEQATTTFWPLDDGQTDLSGVDNIVDHTVSAKEVHTENTSLGNQYMCLVSISEIYHEE